MLKRGCGSWLGPVFGSLVVVGSGAWVVGRGWVWCLSRGWVVGPVFGSWVTAWVSGGCGFWRGSLWWL